MSYIGRQPTAAALTASDITDGIVSNAKLAQDIISADTALGAEPATTDEFLVSDAGTLKRMDYSYIKAANTPAFSVYNSSDQDSVSAETWTKVTLDAEDIDTDSAFASDKFTVPANEDGKYLFIWFVWVAAGDNNLQRVHTALYKNGVFARYGAVADWTNEAYRNSQGYQAATIMDLSAADYVEVYIKAWIGTGDATIESNASGVRTTKFEGYKLIGV